MTIKYFFTTALSRFYELLIIPIKDPEILWVITPLLIATIIMFIYFQKYKDEELGWNSAVANSLVSLFVSIYLLKYIYLITTPGTVLNFVKYLSRTIFALLLFFITFVLLIINFSHILPKKIAYHISSPLTMNLISYLGLVFVYSSIPSDWLTFVVLLVFFIILRMLLYLVQFPVVKLFSYLSYLKEQEDVEEIKRAHKKIKQKREELKKEREKEGKIKQIKIKKKELQKKKGFLGFGK